MRFQEQMPPSLASGYGTSERMSRITMIAHVCGTVKFTVVGSQLKEGGAFE